MPEDAGKLEVEYVVMSDAAMRRLERLQKALKKVEEAAEKQGETIDSSFKLASKAMAGFGVVATGVLYGIIRASAYSSMWLDQISHQMTRLGTKITEMLGLDKAIEFFIDQLDNLNDELMDPKDNDFWKRLASDFWDLSLKAKLATIAIIAISGVLGVAAIMGFIVGLELLIVAFAGTTTAAILTKVALWALSSAIAILTSPVTLIIVGILALTAVLIYLWSKTKIGKIQIEHLTKIWNKFKTDISDIGWKDAIINALKNLGEMGIITIIWIVKKWYTIFTDLYSNLKNLLYDMGIKIINALIDGINKYFPGFSNIVNKIYDKFNEILTYIKTFSYNKGVEIINKLVEGINTYFPAFSNIVNKIYNKFNEVLTYIKTFVYTKGLEIITKLVEGINTYFPGFSNIVNKIYNKFNEVLTYIKTFVYTKGQEIINKLKEGINKYLPGFLTVLNKIRSLWDKTGDDLVYSAEVTGQGMTQKLIDAGNIAETTIVPPWERAGKAMKEGMEYGFDGTSSSVCDEMTSAYDCVETGVANIASAFDGLSSQEINIQLIIDGSLSQALMDQVNAALDAGEYVAGGFGWQLDGWQNNAGGGGGGDYVAGGTGWQLDGWQNNAGGGGGGGGGGGYSAASWSAGWQNAALGGHITQTGTSVVHQGEDIMHLKSLLSGIRGNEGSKGDITINPVINISSNSMSGDSFEMNRIADMISKRMGNELRRITTGI